METAYCLATSFAMGWIAAMSPGPDTIVVLRSVSSDGRKAGFLCTLGIGTGVLIHAVGALLLALFVEEQAPALLTSLQLGGMAFLLYLGGRLLTTHHSTAGEAIEKRSAAAGFFWQGFLTNLLNPKSLVFYLSVVTPLIRDAEGFSTPIAAIVGVTMAVPIWFLTLSVGAGSIARWLTPTTRLMIDRVAGFVFIAFAIFGSIRLFR